MKSKPLKEWIQETEEKLKVLKSLTTQQKTIDDHIDIFSLQDKIRIHSKQLLKYPDALIWEFKDITPMEQEKINILNEKFRLHKGNINDLKDLELILNNQYTKERFLEENLCGPEKKHDDEIMKIFNSLLFYVNSHENYKFMQQNFALALSEEEESMEFFELFIYKTSPSLKKLENNLGITDY